MLQIPIIDFSNFASDDETIKQIYQACTEVGFMYLKNFDISQDLIEQVFNTSKHFFNQPLEIKQKSAWSDEFSNQGYVGIERERLNPNKPGDLKEAFNITTQTQQPYIVEFFQACTNLANQILEAFARALELPVDFFANNHNQNHHTLRLLHYPPIQTPLLPEQTRAGEHSDYGSITLLFQHDEISGLEIQTASGDWIKAPAIPGTVVVNTGDLMQRWTNNKFCSTKHRVVIPENTNQSRYSIAFFCHPNDDTQITCLPSCINESPMYPPISAKEYLLTRLQSTY
ncbi:2OG-Fe(II) oxygenase [Dulcicalothrix desertica PCC 7102]|uniref:2OG-Fe(II) oxygenase n=1 Tax=Dulcicalothrix desertica PCC 7102 TaxID=232991 RepID=A0A3S1DHB6_9CYAN|nr:2OG-Fe(II) oxygenase family protein [Dulcicalothrix desertica]RUT09956.1 2OG-Fe(II) oxygenase [Dulcicalothrix desertica PCC 7102]TWH41062.1 isopenicillin N synthase-like dioxygenase [Dulcicalothrix desertica PCC 7102]